MRRSGDPSVRSGWAYARWRRAITRSMKFSPEIGTKNREDVPGEIKNLPYTPLVLSGCRTDLRSKPSMYSKSAGLHVKSGRSLASATAAIIAS